MLKSGFFVPQPEKAAKETSAASKTAIPLAFTFIIFSPYFYFYRVPGLFHPFTEPTSTPLANCFWISGYTQMMGTVATTIAA